MKFKSVAEAFNYYKDYTQEAIELRLQQVKHEIRSNNDADVESFNIEVLGLKEAKENIMEKRYNNPFMPTQNKSINNFALPTDDEIFKTKEYRSAFYKNLMGQNLNENELKAFETGKTLFEKRANDFNTITDSASIIPTQTLNEIIKKATKEMSLINEVRAFNVPSNIDIPVATPGDKANWHTEGSSVDGEKVGMTNVKFKSNEILKIFSISASVQKMSIDAFESYLVEELTRVIMATINDSLINGTGKGQGKGLETIIWTLGENLIEYTSNIEYQTITNALASLKKGYSKNAKFVMNNTTLYSQVYNVLDAQGKPLFITDLNNGNIGHILGKEVVIDDDVADGDIYLGNCKYLGYNLPSGIAIEKSTQSSFKSGLIDFRGLAIADTQTIVSDAFIKIQKKL